MVLTEKEWAEMRAIGDSLDTSWGAMEQEVFEPATERYNELQKKLSESAE